MIWRTWLKTKLDAGAPYSGPILTTSIYGAGSLTGTPKKKPFIMIRVGSDVPVFNEGGIPEIVSKEGVVWVHDEPGSYDTIDQVLSEVIAQLAGQVSEVGGIACVWQGSSPELADDAYGTITRNCSFRLVGKEG